MTATLDEFKAIAESVHQAEVVLESANRARREAPRRAQEVLEPLVAYWRKVEFRARERDPAEEQRLERAFKNAIAHYRVRPRDALSPGTGFVLVDPKPDAEYDVARDELSEARRVLDLFVQEHEAALKQELGVTRARAQRAVSAAQERVRAAQAQGSEVAALDRVLVQA